MRSDIYVVIDIASGKIERIVEGPDWDRSEADVKVLDLKWAKGERVVVPGFVDCVSVGRSRGWCNC